MSSPTTLAPRARKVKILATLGPASSEPRMIRSLMLAGADALLETYRQALGLE